MFFVPIPRKIAKERGLKHYFTGGLCIRGGIGKRLVSTASCRCFICFNFRKEVLKQRMLENPEHYAIQRKRASQQPAAKLRRAAYQKKRSIEEPQKLREIEKKSYNKHRDARNEARRKYLKLKRATDPVFREKSRLHSKSCREAVRKDPVKLAASRAWRRNYDNIRNSLNPFKNRLGATKRKAAKANAIVWQTELDLFVQQELVQLKELRDVNTGIVWHIDHMIPLRAKEVCGLHVWNNLQCLPETMNLCKNNKLIYTNPHEWLYDIPKFFKVVYQKEIAA